LKLRDRGNYKHLGPYGTEFFAATQNYVTPLTSAVVSYFAELCVFATLREQNFSAVFTLSRQVAKLRKVKSGHHRLGDAIDRT